MGSYAFRAGALPVNMRQAWNAKRLQKYEKMPEVRGLSLC